MLNTKIHYKSKNTIQLQLNNNCIPDLLMAYSVVVDGDSFWNGVNILAIYKYGT